MTTVLVVEDETLIAGDIQETLVRLGYEVPVTVGTGDRAVSATAEWNPSLILMDIKLRGDMDGVEAAAAIRSQVDVPIVYLTSHSDEHTLTRAKETGPHGYLLKPFTERELRTAIEVALHRHQLEMKLAERERWYSTTLRSIGDAVVTTDPTERITFVNEVAGSLTGWGEDAVGMPFTQVFDVVDRAGQPIPSMAGLAIACAGPVDLPDRSSLRTKTGQTIAIDDVASPIVDARGATLGSVVVFRDVTSRRALEERVNLSERLASLGTLAAGVAHEINNPLSFVVTNLELSVENIDKLQQQLEPAPAASGAVQAQIDALRTALTDARSGADRVRVIVRDLMGFVRGGTGVASSCDLDRALAAALQLTNHMVRGHARVRREGGAMPNVLGDEHAFTQVFSNLLLNAAQAIGGSRPSANEIIISSRTGADGWAVVEVRDTGPGIAPEVLPRLFDPFFTTKPPGSGTGLGLAISHNIVADAGGFLTAANAPEGGAVFRVALPPAPDAPGRPDAAQGTSQAPGRRGTVLVIDDEAMVARVVERILKDEHDVTVASNVEAALALCKSGAIFDVVLCDLQMPGLHGYELAHRVKQLNPQLAQRFVFVSGGPMAPDAGESFGFEDRERIHKPFAAAALRALVNRMVNAPGKA